MKHFFAFLIMAALCSAPLFAGATAEEEAVKPEELPGWVYAPRLAAHPAYTVRAVGISGDFDAADEALARTAAEQKALESLSRQAVSSVQAETLIVERETGAGADATLYFSTMAATSDTILSRGRFLEYHTVGRYGKIRCYVLAGISQSDFRRAAAAAEEKMRRDAEEQRRTQQAENNARAIYQTLQARNAAAIPTVTADYYGWVLANTVKVFWDAAIPAAVARDIEQDWKRLPRRQEPTIVNYRQQTVIYPADNAKIAAIGEYLDYLPYLGYTGDGNNIFITATLPADRLTAAHATYSQQRALRDGYTVQINYNGLAENEIFLEEIIAMMQNSRYRLDLRAENILKINLRSRIYSPSADYNTVEISARARWERADGTSGRYNTAVYSELYSDEQNFNYRVEEIQQLIAEELNDNLDSLLR